MMSKASVGMVVMLLCAGHSAVAQFRPQAAPSDQSAEASRAGQTVTAERPQTIPGGSAGASKDQDGAGRDVETAQNTTGGRQDSGPASEYVGEMYRIGLGWHPAALRDVPKDKYGLADWVAMLEQGVISPQPYLDPDELEDPPLDLEIAMPSNTNLLAGAHFPHSIHTTWLACESCHVKIFMPQVGANDLTMSRIVKGEACGVCHGKVAFPLNHCERCHVPGTGALEQTAATP